MIFENKCKAIFDKIDLETAIKNKCEQCNKKIKGSYIINLRGGYPSICIAHEHYRLHSLLGEIYYKNYEIIHHKDGNKLNASKENLVPMTNSEHTKHHHIIDFVPEEYKKSFGKRMADKIRRSDVTEENVCEMRNQGFTILQISKKLNCGYNTVCRRLGMKA